MKLFGVALSGFAAGGLLAALFTFGTPRGHVHLSPLQVQGDATRLEVLAILEPWNPEQAQLITGAVTYYSRLVGIDPHRLARRLVVESRVKPWARGPTIPASRNACKPIRDNALGLGQVMPTCWVDVFPQCGSMDSLLTIAVNVCYSAYIWRTHLEEAGGDVRKAHRLYLGCVRCTHSDEYIRNVEEGL